MLQKKQRLWMGMHNNYSFKQEVDLFLENTKRATLVVPL